MLLTLSVSAFAAETPFKRVSSNGYTFVIEERTADNGSITRVFSRNNQSRTLLIADKDFSETKAILSVLGMTDRFISQLTDDELQEYAASPNISCTVSYTRQKEDGTVEYIDQYTAETEAAYINSIMENYQSINENARGDSASFTPYVDSYMRVTVTVSEASSGEFWISGQGDWLTMPFFRSKDSIGACMNDGNVVGNASARYYYNMTVTQSGQTTTTPCSFTISNFQYPTKDGWFGVGASFGLPNDYSDSSGTRITYSNLGAYIRYKASIDNPQLVTNFNASATYSHATVAVVASNPTISISTDGVSAAIGLSVAGSVDNRTAIVYHTYTP